MKKYLCTLTISISLFLIAGPVDAQYDPGIWRGIDGYVTDCGSCGTGGPLSGVAVRLEPEAWTNNDFITDDDGFFTFFPLSEGCYTLKFWKPGYGAVTKTNVCVNNHTTWRHLNVCLD